MDPKEAKEWFGNTPPDLTLEAGLRGPDWIYTYLKSFYIDDSRPPRCQQQSLRECWYASCLVRYARNT